MKPKTKMKISTAVADYIRMFPEEYNQLMAMVTYQKEHLQDDMAEVKTHSIKRALFTISEKLSTMIGKKLDEEEMISFKTKEGGRWFAKEFPQFRITKEI